LHRDRRERARLGYLLGDLGKLAVAVLAGDA
jgi:hypothetical protein